MNGTDLCSHLSQVTEVKLSDEHVCEECIKHHGRWLHLRTCQACGSHFAATIHLTNT